MRTVILLLPFALLLAPRTAGAEQYEYDPQGRLSKVTYDDGSSISYAYDANGNALKRDAQSTGATGDAEGSWCFVATAAWGSPLQPQVVVLRQFRDRWLQTHAPGRWLVRAYYASSPPLAAAIARDARLRAAARWALTPVVLAVAHPGAFWGLAAAGMVGLALLRRRRRR